MQKKYDYIFIWRWLASSALFLEMCQNPHFNDSTILILDPQRDHPNQTRSFRADPTHFPIPELPLTFREYSKIQQWDTSVISNYGSKKYCQLNSKSWRSHVAKQLQDSQLKYTHMYESVTHRSETTAWEIQVHTQNSTYVTTQVFNSNIGFNFSTKPRDISITQKFVGYTISCEQPVFEKDIATLMDFQDDGEHICFVYILPTSKHDALIEYTYFDESLCLDIQYIQQKLDRYLKRYPNYTILQKESWIIPMSTFQFENATDTLRHIGTAGWCSKPSSGYTFLTILRDSKRIVMSLTQTSPKRPRVALNRHRWYDMIMLYLMKQSPWSYPSYILDLFKHTPSDTLIAFMNETSTLFQELSIIKSLPKIPFIKAFFAVTLRTWKLKIQSLWIISSSSW